MRCETATTALQRWALMSVCLAAATASALSSSSTVVHIANAAEEEITADEIIMGILCIVAGGVICFVGYRLFRPLMFFAGFFFGYWLCYIIMTNVDVDYGENEAWIVFGSCLGSGIVMGLLMVCLYGLGIFILGALAGFFLAIWILSFVPSSSPLQEDLYRGLFISGMALVFAILTVVLSKPVIILASAMVGSYVLFYGIDMFAQTGFADAIQEIVSGKPIADLSDPLLAMLICSLVAAFLGALVQLKLTSDWHHQDDPTKRVYIQIN